MATTILNPISNTAALAGQQTEMIELVSGREKELLEWLTPLVRRQSVTLDLRSFERIDAAGIAALVSLYSSARQAGHCFSVANLSPHVAEDPCAGGAGADSRAPTCGLECNSGSRLEHGRVKLPA